MRLPWRRGRVHAARRQAAHMPAHLSFRGRREPTPSTRGRSDGAQRLSFRRRKPDAQLPRGGQDLARGLSFRRRRAAKQPAPRARTAGSLSFRRPRTKPHATKAQTIKLKVKVRIFGRRGARSPRPQPQREPDGAALVLRLVWVGLAAGMLQLLVVSQIVIGGVSADLTPLVVAAAGFLCGSLAGAGFGFGLGLFVDLAFMQTLGISSLLFTLIGYGAGRLRELRAPAAPLTRLLLGTVATITALAGYGAIEFMLGVNTPVSAGLLGAIIKTTLLNSLIAVPVYALTRKALLGALPASERRPRATASNSGSLSPLSRA